jgi:hypothetical protein
LLNGSKTCRIHRGKLRGCFDQEVSATVGWGDGAESPAKVETTFAELGLTGRLAASDVWAQRSLGALEGSVAADVEPHGVALLVLEPQAAAAGTPAK